MKAYKVFNSDWKCRDMQYEVGKEFTANGKIVPCKNGLHACLKLADCFSYYSFDPNNKVAEVDVLGVAVEEDSKIATDRMLIVKEITWQEVLEMVNTGNGCTGYRNSGYRNSGDLNSGNLNSGNWNSGDRNSGNRNSGNRNSGNRNSGNRNSGYLNSGDRNSGDWNSGNRNSGYLNSKTPADCLIFNKKAKFSDWDKADKPDFFWFDLTVWVSHDTATESERTEYAKEIETCGGFLKTLGYKEAFKLSYANASQEDRDKVKNLPNWDADVFFEISGIRVE